MSLEKKESDGNQVEDPARRGFLKLAGLLAGGITAGPLSSVSGVTESVRRIPKHVLLQFKESLRLQRIYKEGAIEYSKGNISREALLRMLKESEEAMKKALFFIKKYFKGENAKHFIQRKQKSLERMRTKTLKYADSQRDINDRFEKKKQVQNATLLFLNEFDNSKNLYDEYKDECFFYLNLESNFEAVQQKFVLYEESLRKVIEIVSNNWDTENARCFVMLKEKELQEERAYFPKLKQERLYMENREALLQTGYQTGITDTSLFVQDVIENEN